MKAILRFAARKTGRFSAALFLFSALGFSAFGQTTLQVKGRISDGSDQQTLPGVSVSIKNTLNGTSTSLDGLYVLENVPSDAVLIFSFIGYKTQEVPLNGRTSLDISLQRDLARLDEVVVVGYGTQKKINVTGAVDQISGEDIEKRPVANAMQALQGASPGLNITYSGGKPGTVPKINVRGFTSINGGSPLIVIDGIASTSHDLLRINPSDIASVSVLRDAASAAIYGARAAFGVVLVSTKKGAVGKQVISYNNYFSVGNPTVLPQPVTDPYIFSRVLETATNNTPWDYVNFSDEYYAWARERSNDPSVEAIRPNPSDPSKWAYMGNNDWYDYFFYKSSFSQNHSVSLSGNTGPDSKVPLGYYLSADYTKENGMNKLAPDHWDRYSLRARVNASPLKWLKIDNNLNIYQTLREDPTTNITDVYYLQPTDMAQNPDGTWANTETGRLAARLVNGGSNREDMNGFHNITRVEASFLKGDLKITGDASFKRELWKYHWNQTKYSIGYGPEDIRQEGGIGSVTERNGLLTNNVFDLYANYNKSFGDHSFGLMLGYNQEDYNYSTVQSEKKGLISSSLPYINLTTGDAFINADYDSYGIRSYFGRFNYAFKGKYILEANARYDGSSRFPTSNRWGLFPSISGAWIASSEDFMDGLTSAIPTLKFRASYGSLGNQEVSYFGYLQTLPAGLSDYLIAGERETVVSSAPSLSINPRNYTWEKVTTANFGTDIGLLKNKLLLTFDYYERDTKGMLTAGQELPAVLGTSIPKQNSADLATKGWELSLAYQNTYQLASKPFTINTKFILSDSRSWITKFQNKDGLFSNYRVGQQIGEIWGLTNNGFFANEEEIAALDESELIPWGALKIVPGWPKYVDMDGNQKIEQGDTENEPKDLSIIGNSSARYRFGLNLNMAWNGFDVSLFVQGVGKADYYPRHYLFWGPYQQPYANVYPWNLDFYRGEAESAEERAKHSQSYIDAGLADANTDATYPVLQSWMADANYGAGLDIPQTDYLLSGAYLRIKNITLGYTLPTSFTRRFKISRLRLFASGENLFEFSKIKEFVDPESINGGYGWAYPFQRKYAFGLNIEF